MNVTKIYNKYSSDKISINFENKKKNIIVFTWICGGNKILLEFEYMDTNLAKTKLVRNKIKHDINVVNHKKYIHVYLFLLILFTNKIIFNYPYI